MTTSTACLWCHNATLDPCTCTEPCGYDWCPATARHLDAELTRATPKTPEWWWL